MLRASVSSTIIRGLGIVQASATASAASRRRRGIERMPSRIQGVREERKGGRVMSNANAHPGKTRYPAALMKKFRMITVSDEFTTALVVAQPTPSLPPNVVRPARALTMGIAAP